MISFAIAPAIAIPALATVGGSLISGITNMLSSKKANDANLKAARETNATSIQIARENNEFARQHAIDMFNLENAYNDPSAQVERLSKAGLNPAVVMEGAGGSAAGNSSGAGMISPSMPSLTTPHVEAVPPMAMGFIDALQKFADIKVKEAEATKKGAETSEITTLLDSKFKELAARADVQAAQARYQDTLNRLEAVHGDVQRVSTIKKLAAEATLAELKGETEKADKLLKDAEFALTNTKNSQLIEQAPVILANLREEGRLLRAKQATEKSHQSLNYAAASEHRAGASVKEETVKLTRAEVKIKEELIDDLIYAQRLANGRAMQELGELAATFPARVRQLKDKHLIDEETYKELEQKRELAEKTNSWYYWHEYLNFFESVSRDVGNVAKMIPTPAR